MKKLLGILVLGLLFNFSAKANNLNVIDRVKDLGTFTKPSRYPDGMHKIFGKGCKIFFCQSKKAIQAMGKIFNRTPIYFERHPGAQLHGMAMFELFYQQRLKENQKKIDEFMASWPDKKKHKHTIVSLMKLNDSRKKMRSAMGMDLTMGIEEAMESFWLMGDFLEQGERKKQNVDKAIATRGELLAKYKKAVNTFNSEIKRKKEEEFYEKITKKGWTFGGKDLDDKFKDFVKDTNEIRKEFSSLPASNFHKAKSIDKAFKVIETTTKFVSQSFNKGDIEVASTTLSFADKSISDIAKLIPQKNFNDMSNIDIGKLGENAFKKIAKITSNIKRKKSEGLAPFVQNMAKIHRKGFNTFQTTRKLKDLGVDTLSFKNISKAIKVGTPTEADPSNEQVNLLDKRIDFTKKYMDNLGYSAAEIKKEVDVIKLVETDNIKGQGILIARHMIIGGASDEEIQKEINDWNAININNLKEEAYLAALNMKATGVSAKEIQKKVEMINAVEVRREVDELLGEIEDKIAKKYNTENFSSEAPDEETLVFAQASKDKFLDDDFESEKNELFFNQFFQEKEAKQEKSFVESATGKYRRISTPLTIISVIISPNPFNVYQLTKKVKDNVDAKKAKILAISTYGTGEDDLASGDYVDPRIFARTAQILMDLQKKSIESQYLAKKFNYSITLISAEVEKYEEPERPDDEDKDKKICVAEECYTTPAKKTPSEQKNPLKAIDNVIKQASSTGRADLIKKMELMIKDKNIPVYEVADFITLETGEVTQDLTNIITKELSELDVGGNLITDIASGVSQDVTGQIIQDIADVKEALAESGAVIRGASGTTISIEEAYRQMPEGGIIQDDGSLLPCHDGNVGAEGC